MSLSSDQIAVVHGASQNLQEVSSITFPNHAEYASKHGYVLKTLEIDSSESVWGKIRVLQEVFANPNIRKALWIDTDAIFTNTELSLTHHLPDKKMVMACDTFGPNAGVIWLENCPEVRRFLETIATMGRQMFETALWREQAAIRYFSLYPPYDKLITYVDQSLMNAYLLFNQNYPIGKPPQDGFGGWRPGDFIMHLPGLQEQLRILAFKTFFSEGPAGLRKLPNLSLNTLIVSTDPPHTA